MERIGVRYDLHAPGLGAGGHGGPPYEAVLEHAAAAEALGAGVLWVAERPFVAGALLPAALPLCAALAERTREVRIATGVLPLPLHHPLRVAEDAASLDVLSGGRFELGVGLGGHAEGFSGFGVPARERAGRFEEALALVRAAWTATPVTFAGRHFHVEDLTVHPRPVQRPHPPLWIAGGAEAAVRRAARLGTGLLTDSLDAAARFLDAWQAEGRPRGEARVAWHVDPGRDAPGSRLPAVVAALERLAGARAELVLAALPAEDGADGVGPAALEASLRTLERWLEALRPSFAAAAGGPPDPDGPRAPEGD